MSHLYTENAIIKCRIQLNVYDLVEANWNDYVYFVGFGIHHTGIVIFGQEFSYGAHEEPTSGIFAIEPLSATDCRHRTTIDLGETKISLNKFRSILQGLGTKFTGDSYHILTQNCNHFSNELSKRLLGAGVPGWVNRLARTLNYVQCLVPSRFLDAPALPTPTPTNALLDVEQNSSRFRPFSGTPHTLVDDSRSLLHDPNDREDPDTRRRMFEAAAVRRLSTGLPIQ